MMKEPYEEISELGKKEGHKGECLGEINLY